MYGIGGILPSNRVSEEGGNQIRWCLLFEFRDRPVLRFEASLTNDAIVLGLSHISPRLLRKWKDKNELPIGRSSMWVTFLNNRNYSVVLSKGEVEDEAAIEPYEHIITGDLLNLVMNQASVSTEQLLKRDSVKVSIPLCMLNELVLRPLQSISVLRQRYVARCVAHNAANHHTQTAANFAARYRC
ncbi:hypothetical protein HPB50_012238 [Hyalomma asiaticum]|uniref:Uncharacterized protein n=1 Tax=Hyalomma asiaticum TaxID=266040 RepID=A0ACB7TAA0_HYAAI|nr:hypothetical protein HPB50_012238 [Hyalomma asiaticum]